MCPQRDRRAKRPPVGMTWHIRIWSLHHQEVTATCPRRRAVSDRAALAAEDGAASARVAAFAAEVCQE